MSEYEEPPGELMPEDDAKFLALKEAIMLASHPKPGYHIEGLFVMSVWHNPTTEDRNADFLCNPPDHLRNMLEAVVAFAHDTGLA